MATVTDSFTATGPTALDTYDANWTVTAAMFDVTSNALTKRGTSGGGPHGIGWETAFTGDEQFASIKVVQLANDEWTPGPSIRGYNASEAGYGAGYRIYFRFDGVVGITRAGTSVVSSGTWSDGVKTCSNGDVWRLEHRSGGVIVAMQNGTDVWSYTDGSPITYQYVGLSAYYIAGNPTTDFILDDFSGGDLEESASIAPLAMAAYRQQ